MKRTLAALTMSSALVLAVGAGAQSTPAQPAPSSPAPTAPAAGRGGGRGNPAVVSPQIEADGRVTFRVLAPNATTVTVGGDINGSLAPDATAAAAPPPAPGAGGGAVAAVTMTKGENGVWSGTTARRVKPGAWQYTFNIDGVRSSMPAM